MRNPRLGYVFTLALIGLATFIGCAKLDRNIHTSEISGTANRVLARHDSYVTGDVQLSPDQKALDLKQSADARQVLAAPSIAATDLAPKLNPVMTRHDAYVNIDGSLSPAKRKANLDDTGILRSVLKAGRATTQP